MNIRTFNLILLVLILYQATISNANLIKLYNSLHFYEMVIDRPDDISAINFHQSFGFSVLGEGNCALELDENYMSVKTSSSENEFETKLGRDFNLNAQTLIYSNYEFTLSFLLQIDFKSLKQTNNMDIQGYELVFFNEDKSTSCVQIIENKNYASKFYQNRFKFSIKDPSFLSQKNSKFTFYFGKVLVRALVRCNEKDTLLFNSKKLCSVHNTLSNPVEIGIRSNSPIETFSITPNSCEEHLMSQTCILRYSPSSIISSNYYIIMHPFSDLFETMINDIDMSRTGLEYITNSRDDKILKNLNGLSLTETEYYLIKSNDQINLTILHNFTTKRSEKLPNGLVIKMVKYPFDQVNLISIFNEPSDQNPCRLSKNKCYCKTTKSCEPCYSYELDAEKNPTIHYVPLNYEPNSNSVLDKKSRHCDDSFFKPYNFESTKLAVKFQNQDISAKRILFKDSANYLSNRDSLPRPCLNIKYGIGYGFFDIKLIFNDYRLTAQSVLLNETKYRIRIYEYKFKETPTYYKNFNQGDLFQVDSKPIIENDSIEPNNLVEIKNLKKGKYFIELIPIQKSRFCKGVDECIDESIENNKIQCVKCNKLITKFDLENQIFSDNTNFISGDSIPIKNKLSYDECLKLMPVISIKSNNLNADSKVIFKCSKDSNLFKEIVAKSKKRKNDIITFIEDSSSSISVDSKSSDLFDKREIYSTLIPYNYEIAFTRMPYDNSEQTNIQTLCSNVVVSYNEMQTSKYTIGFIISTLIFLLAFFSIVTFTYCVIKSIPNALFFDREKLVVFYLSIYVTDENQKELKNFIEKYLEILKKQFKKIDFKIIEYSTDLRKRTEWIKDSHLVVYVCGTKEEVYNNLKEPFKIGQNLNHDEYNKIQCCKLYSSKTINITFNKEIEMLSFSSQNELSNLQVNQNNSNNREMVYLSPSTSSHSSSSSNSIRSCDQNYFYLTLPKQHDYFIQFLMAKDRDEIYKAKYRHLEWSKSKRHNKYGNRIYNYAFSYCIKKLEESVNKLIEKEKKNSDLFRLLKNINFDEQPQISDSEIVEDLSDVEEIISQMSSTSLSSESRSNQGSKCSMTSNVYIHTETYNETEINPLIREKKC